MRYYDLSLTLLPQRDEWQEGLTDREHISLSRRLRTVVIRPTTKTVSK